MADAIRLVSIRRGYDPRDFALVPLGGAGPLHGGRLAAELSIGRMVVPVAPGVLSALGLLVAAIEHEEAVTVAVGLDAVEVEHMQAIYESLEREVAARMRADRAGEAGTRTQWSADARYSGQAYTLPVAIDKPLSPESLAALRTAFDAAHRRIYGYSDSDAAVELVNARVVQSHALPHLELHAAAHQGAPDATHRRAYFDELGGYTRVPVYQRESLQPGVVVHGPAIVDQADSTLVVYPGDSASVEATGNLMVSTIGSDGARA
jgi:N-methylhydantoinase A